ncbi:probable receptor-like protein kinase At2g23200 [Amaranthus tricolor]|uniref:probable receptor-like protein kinase At2g23200 n=1 Tax=Amaranthus tricolor TaxID=29722 RepID=UPI002587DFEB|nr:probable receptor-like protein kinase At2g23200 [Amaranthus tricolor]
MVLLYFQILLPLLFFTSTCSSQVQYFINCGSSTNTTTNNGQTFVGDEGTSIITISGHGSQAIRNTKNSETLYQTARVFSKASSYDFDIPQNGTYFVRLHFCALSSSLAKFSVLTSSGHILLPDFTPGNKSTNCSSTLPKEFMLSITNTKQKFRIYFVPSTNSSAFVNAVEILSTKSNITEVTKPYVTPAGKIEVYKGEKSKVLETVYRVNVGGQKVKPSSSDLWRTWVPDDRYLINKTDAENTADERNNVHFDPEIATADDAPVAVYGTAKKLRNSAHTSKIPNLIWQFSVNRGTKYVVRVHFCDIISPANGDYTFDLFIYSNFSQLVTPYDITSQTYTPFYKDYIVDSGDLGFMTISVGPIDKPPNKRYLLLNGLEIMQVKNETSKEPHIDSKTSHVALVASLVGFAVVLIVAAILVCLYMEKKKKKPSEVSEWRMLSLYGTTSSHDRTLDGASSHASAFENLQLGLKLPFVEILRLTNNFDVNLIVGEGGFGKVYKGTDRSGRKFAVKRGSLDHGQGVAEFQTEIMILSKIEHRHLVSLKGYCYENGEMILVYEFMEKGTLREHLYNSERSSLSIPGPLSWEQRLKICIGAAKGIQYLHTGTNKGIIHRDVKSTNILLDENYVAKVADFGLSRSGYLEQTQVSISDVKGTLGYLDPEYITCLQLTEKSDVYAFGVVLIEVLCARPVIDLTLPKDQVSLSDWAIACSNEGQLDTIIDPSIASEINPNSLTKFYEIAEKCLNKNAEERPPMSDVCWGLEYALQLQKAATERELLDDTMTNVSLNMPLPAVQRFPSQTITDQYSNDDLLNADTGEVFSQLTFDDGVGR